MRAWVAALAIVATGCVDWGVSAIPNEFDASLVVEPTALDFGEVRPGLRTVRTLSVRNDDWRRVTIDELLVSGPGFALARDVFPHVLEPGEELDVAVHLVGSDLRHVGELTFVSDAIVGTDPTVPMAGTALLPELVAHPVDLGKVRVDCDTGVGNAIVRNIGTYPATVLELSSDAAWLESTPDALPTTLGPGRSWATRLRAAPPSAGVHQDWMQVATDAGALEIPVRIEGLEGEEIVERFVQDQRSERPVSLLIHVDTSPSMKDEIDAVLSMLPELVKPLDAADEPWRAGVVVGDPNGCVVSGVAQDLYGLARAIEEARVIAYAHHAEAPYQALPMTLLRMGERHCNQDLDLPDGVVHLAVISDEADHSAWGWQIHLREAQSVRPDVVVHAITGPVPDGCAGADPGEGHVDAAWDTGGSTTSICGDWRDSLRALAEGIQSDRRAWRLSHRAIADTIEITVDGALTTAWRFDAAVNGIELDEPPAPGAAITVAYQTDTPCESDGG